MSSIGSLHRLLELGRGGMARVWLAVSTGVNGFRKLVVVKQLRPEFTQDERVREMFLEEARLAAKLNHPNTVQTIEVAEQDGEFFIVMEYLDGQPLDSIQRQGPVPLPATLAILADVCAGLHHAHELRDLDGTQLGVVHRDVSPQNVFVTYSGQVKVVDFGIAKTLAGSSVSQAGEIKGKANYMAPEQALGMSVDRRADVFSVGVMLYSALSGRRLWDGTPENRVIERLRVGDVPKLVPRPSGLNAPPPELIAICNKCIAPAARDRYETALEVQVAIEEYAKSHAGMFTRGELAAFLTRSFEEHRTRRQSVIEEKVRLLTEGNLLANSVKRQPSNPPSPQLKAVGKLPPPAPPPRRSSSQNIAAASASISSPHLEQPDRVSRVPTERPAPASKAAQPSKGTWRMPEPYKLVSRLSSSALIFEAKDNATKRGVTVQLLKGALSSEQLTQRFSRAARLRHPNTVRLLDAGSVKVPVPVTYIVRENVVGRSLAERLTEGPLEPLEALRVGTAILDSLTEAHESGVIHGRLAPSHVLLENSSVPDATRVKVLGYWPSPLAVRKQEDEPYQDPAGDEDVSVQSDIFAVGQILHVALFGRPHNTMTLVADAEPKLSAVLNRALDRDPARRYASATAMLDALRHVDWTCPKRGEVVARDRYFCGVAPLNQERRLPVARNELLSKRPVSVWLFDGDPTLARSNVLDALSAMKGQLEVRQLGDADRELAYEELSTGKVSLPWVVIFGPLHVVLVDPLLHLLRTTPEVSRLLVSPSDDFELLHTSVNNVGLDGQVFETADKEEIATSITQMVTRTRQISQAYDAVRLQLQRARDELGQRSRELTATDTIR